MGKITITGKEYKVAQEVVDLLLLLSKERDQLQYSLKLAGITSNKAVEVYSGELFQTKTYMNAC